MKLLLSALCASCIIAPLSYANSAKDSNKEVILADCGKCKKDDGCDKDKDKDKEKKAEATQVAQCGDKCKKDDDGCGKDKEKKAEATNLADCGKCKKDGGCDKDKEKEKKAEAAQLAQCGDKCKKKDDCDKDKKDDDCDKDKKAVMAV